MFTLLVPCPGLISFSFCVKELRTALVTTDCLTLKFPELPEAGRDSVVLKKNLITKLERRVRLGKATVTQSLQLVVPTGVSAWRAQQLGGPGSRLAL